MGCVNSRLLLCSVLVGASSLSTAAEPQWKVADGFTTDWEHVSFSQQKLSDTVYYLQGSGGNMLVSAGPDGVLLVDDEFAEITDKIVKQIGAIKPGPIKFVLNTHFHNDHTGGNENLGKMGSVIIANEKSRERMKSESYNAHFDSVTPASPPAALPVVTFKDSLVVHFNNEDIKFFFVSAAHTDGDSIVWFPKSNVVHMGDVYINELYPIIDLAGGGRIDGYFPAIDAVLAVINDKTRVVPGHGPIGDKASLRVYRDMLQLIRDRVVKLIKEGKTLDAIKASNPSKEFDRKWASDRVGPDDVTKMIYQSLTGNFPTKKQP